MMLYIYIIILYIFPLFHIILHYFYLRSVVPRWDMERTCWPAMPLPLWSTPRQGPPAGATWGHLGPPGAPTP